jgi:hypothetical protein
MIKLGTVTQLLITDAFTAGESVFLSIKWLSQQELYETVKKLSL